MRLADGRVALLNQLHIGHLAAITSTTLAAGAGAAVLTATGFLKAGMRILGVTTQILYSLGTSQGLTAFVVGDGLTIDRWGQSQGLTAGYKTEQGQFHDATWPIYATNTDVVLSALGGLFDAAGQVEITVHYFPLLHRSAR